MGAYLIVVLAVLVAGLLADVVLRASARGSERSPVLIGLLAAILASIPIAAPAAMPEAPVTAEPPALVVLFDASSAGLPQAEIRSAIGRELGCTVRDAFDPALGVVSVQVHQNEIVVGYQPPAGELERKLPVSAGGHQLPLLVALVAENLVYRDAGIALPLAPPGVSGAPAPAPVETGRMVLAARVDDTARDRPVPAQPARTPSPGEVRGAGLDWGARVGLFGRVSRGAEDGPGALSFGLNGRLNLPVAGRVRLGAEGGLARLASNPAVSRADSNGRPGRLWVAHVSVGPSVLLSRAGASSEVELSSSVGMTYPFAIDEENADEQRAADGRSNVAYDYHGEIGYRLAGALGFRRWFGGRWAVHAAIGVEHHRLVVSRMDSVPATAAPPQQRLEAMRWTEPTLQAGASLRF